MLESNSVDQWACGWYDVLWEKENQGEQCGWFILNRLAMVLTAQLSANSLELAKSHCLLETNKL